MSRPSSKLRRAPSRCPSCGLTREDDGVPALSPPFPASPGCWELFGQLTADHLERAHADFPHQHAVDTYAVQHPGPPAKPIALWFGLVGLYLWLEKEWTGRQVQRAHMSLAARRPPIPELSPPAGSGSLTVGDVITQRPGEPRDHAMADWGRAVWSGWSAQHRMVASLLGELEPLRSSRA